jgi:hypothetical protein
VASWPDEEQAFDDIVAHVTRAVADVWRRVSNLAPRNRGFIGREDLLAQLHETDAAALTGIDGAGKSAAQKLPSTWTSIVPFPRSCVSLATAKLSTSDFMSNRRIGNSLD